MKEPLWLSKVFILAAHERTLAEHGGATGVRDDNLLESALAKPIHLFSYGKNITLYDCAAAYAFGIAKNHPFVDGNKRTAFIAAVTFLDVHDLELDADEIAATQTMLQLAAGEINEQDYSKWLRENCK